MSNQMDPWLAQIYGTGGGDDLEKTAQMHLLSKLAEEEGIDLSGLSDEEVAQLAADVGEPEEEIDENAVEQQAQQVLLQKEAEAKFEEADFLGRVMAHAYTNELSKIASVGGAARALGREVSTAAKGHASKGYHGLKRGVRRAGQLLAGGEARTFGGSKGPGAGRPGNRSAGFYDERTRGEALKSLGARGVAAGAVGAGTYGAHEATKKASAFQKLAEMRANEMLEAAGGGAAEDQQMQGQPPMQGQQGQQMQGQPQQSGPLAARIQQMRSQQPQQTQMQQQGAGEDEQFEDLVNQRALQILSENGYNPEEVVQALGQ